MTDPLAGKPLRYLIGFGGVPLGEEGAITEVAYDCNTLPRKGMGIGYINLYDENYDAKHKTGEYGPYLNATGTAAQYDEGVIDPKGAGWLKNLTEQFRRRQKSGFVYIELDNPDAYKWADVKGAIELAATYGLHVIAKNPGACDGPHQDMDAYVKHPNVCGIIVEEGAGTPDSMDRLRKVNLRPTLPVWFVGFGLDGHRWTGKIAARAKMLNMGATNSPAGEYVSAVDVVKPSAN